MQSWVSCKSVHLYDIEFDLWNVGLPSIVMWGDRGEVRCCGWARYGMLETIGVRQVMWFVLLKSAKDRVIGVDTLGQQVPPRVWYRTAWLLIRDVVGSVPCSDEWEFGVVTRLGSHGERGVMVPWLPREIVALLWYRDYLSQAWHTTHSKPL
jgi:hypothetical protein